MQAFNLLELQAKFQMLSSNAVSMDVDAAPSTATCTTPPQAHFYSEGPLDAATQHAMERGCHKSLEWPQTLVAFTIASACKMLLRTLQPLGGLCAALGAALAV